MSENVIKFDKTNVQSELLFCGVCYKQPETYIKYGQTVRSKYDFSDDACRFFYDQFENYYLTFSQEITENKVNTYMSENTDRFKSYRKYGGWNTIKSMMELADPNDVKNIYNSIKKYSLIREYDRNGFPAEKILQFKGFQSLTANDIYRLMRSKCDKINTVISNVDEPVILTDNTSSLINSYLNAPEFGTPSCFPGFNEFFRGYLKTKVLFNGFMSNEGKSRYMIRIVCDIALKQKKSCMLLSNEQTENDFHNALVTTVVNNPEFQEMHGIKINKPEKEITMGLYRSDKTHEFMYRKMSPNGDFIETQEEFISRVESESSEYRDIMKISQWIDEQTKDKLIYFLDISDDYSDERLDTEIRKAKLCYACEYIFLDTMKCYGQEEWGRLKLTATKLCELCKQNDMYMMASFQLTDSTAFDDIFSLTSNNIAAAKGIKHTCDLMGLGKKIDPEDYHKYQYIPFNEDDCWGDVTELDLNPDKRYFGQFIDKNRLGERNKVLLYEYDLNLNTWNNIGLLIKKPSQVRN